MFSSKVIIVVSMLAIVVQGQYSMKVHAIQYEPVDETKFLGRVGKHFSLLNNISDYLLKLFMINDAEEMSAEAK